MCKRKANEGELSILQRCIDRSFVLGMSILDQSQRLLAIKNELYKRDLNFARKWVTGLLTGSSGCSVSAWPKRNVRELAECLYGTLA